MTTYEVNPIGIIRCSEEGFFLRRPIFSTVISLIITLVGAIAISVLPVEQYPDLTPPQVEVNATYTGASANVIAETVASLLESQINGVDNMIYMNSVSSGTGSMSLTVSFNVGTDPDQATIDVNNRVQLALAQLPQEVQRMGVSVLKKSSSMLQIIFLTSPDQRYNTIYLSNYALLNIVDEHGSREEYYPDFMSRWHEAFVAEMVAFTGHVRDNTKPADLTVYDGTAVSEAAYRCKESFETGKMLPIR